MGILQAAYKTYESQAARAGMATEQEVPLTPVSHIAQNAQIELTITADGEFSGAAKVPKADAKTIIPLTMGSANRTSTSIRPHPLSDQLRYLAAFGGKRYELYLSQLEEWAASEHSHPKVETLLKYIKGGTIVGDLAAAELIALDETGQIAKGGIEGVEYEKCLIRWRIIPIEKDKKSAFWEDTSLMDAFINYYEAQSAGEHRDICMVSGKDELLCPMHPKGVISGSFSAKLISPNSSNFVYKGRFTKAEQAYNLGYDSSHKAHNALSWVVANQGIYMGGRTFICWNPNGLKVPSVSFFARSGSEPDISPDKAAPDFVSYKKELHSSLSGYRQALKPVEEVAIASLEAATTGRLSVTYYNELSASDFLDRIEAWYETFCWETRWGIKSPNLSQIVNYAFGTQRSEYVTAEDKVIKDNVQRLYHCVVDLQPLPADIVKALANRASAPLAYNSQNRENLLITACAVIRKYLNDRQNKEVWKLALDLTNHDRSYLFGRLLAVAEKAEKSSYGQTEGRETNAIRMQSVFSQRPMYAWRIIYESLTPYLTRLPPGQREYYKGIMTEIIDLLPADDDKRLNKGLDDVYLLGYFHQRSAMYKKKNTSEKEKENESAE